MKQLIRAFLIALPFLAVCRAGTAQGTINISYANKVVSGNTWTFDVVASAAADYVAPDNDWQGMVIRFDINTSNAIVSGTGTANTTDASVAGVALNPPGNPPPGWQELGLTFSRTTQPDLTSTPVTLGTFTITFTGTVDPATVVQPRTTLNASGSNWSNTIGTVRRPISEPSTFVLPVNITSFTGTATGCTANLAWATATESNSSYYAVEASVDGSNFNQVGKVVSLNNYEGSSYKYAYAMGSSTYYFRLKAVDLDGKFTYSPIVSVKGSGACSAGVLIQVSPNPTANTVNVQGVQGGSHISLLDANGKKLTEVVATGTSQSINLSTFASGVYLLRIQAADGSTSNVKVVKQ